MSEEKLSEELQEETEVAVEVDDASETPEPTAKEPEQEARDLTKELSEAQDEVASLRDRLLRMAADTENFKKRVERERLAGLKYAGESIFREILPVVDNLERAVEQGNPEGGDTEKSVQALHEGVQLTLKSLVNILEKFEVKPIESTGKPFDPQQQDAMTMEESDTIPANHVLREFQKGYYYKDRLLRAAKVVVSSGKTDTKS
ncbi:MAG: nucleotide exchange factor GrpE [Desulfobacterales bacterium GWB2_56_26]|nr:MAG: nucleotide exchange factor GrpE [Desulfobacterales bacterium GWB2_56_26]HBG20065.1 nucleotide exchange factor GrpE [Desulfobulbaceae bacterium]